MTKRNTLLQLLGLYAVAGWGWRQYLMTIIRARQMNEWMIMKCTLQTYIYLCLIRRLWGKTRTCHQSINNMTTCRVEALVKKKPLVQACSSLPFPMHMKMTSEILWENGGLLEFLWSAKSLWRKCDVYMGFQSISILNVIWGRNYAIALSDPTDLQSAPAYCVFDYRKNRKLSIQHKFISS